jgi:UDP-3-O-[3-hydroxymyristoyl] glucosamine N-acyltransferase
MSSLSTRELAVLIGGELRGEGTRMIDDVAGLDDATASHLTFLDGATADSRLSTAAGAVILAKEHADVLGNGFSGDLILSRSPRDAFVTAMLHFRPPGEAPQVGLSPLARISPTARMGADCHVFSGATILDDVHIGDRCVIHPGAVVGAGCRLGDDVTIHANAVLYAGVTLGNRVIVHATAVIGADGFGYQFRDGRFVKSPHTGTVRIEDDVEIGASATIDRAMIGATVIGAGTKLDNQVMIAHNCKLGRHNAFASQVGLAGSVTTGDYVRCGGQVGVADHAHLGTGSSIGGKAGVHGTVPDGADYHGYPAGPAKEQYRIVMAVQRVPEMRRQIRELQQQVKHLQSLLASAELLQQRGKAA